MLSAIKFIGLAAAAISASMATCQKITASGGLEMKDGEISASKACEVASKAAEGLGLGKFETKKYTACLRPVQGSFSQENKGPREWLLVYLNSTHTYAFRIDTKDGELIGYQATSQLPISPNTNQAKLGAYAATKNGFKAKIAKHLLALGIHPPEFMFLSLRYNHQGTLAYDSHQALEAHFNVAGRYYQIELERNTGNLVKLDIGRNGPTADTVPEDYKNKVDYSKALEAALRFAKKIGFTDVSKEQFYGSFTGPNRSHPAHWTFAHNRFIIYVNALSNTVSSFYNLGIEERFERGDKKVATDSEELKKIIAKVGNDLDIDPQAALDAAIRPTMGHGGTEGPPIIEGVYRIGNKQVARLTFDLYKGELISVQINPNGLEPAVYY